jgi:hypothetical protein
MVVWLTYMPYESNGNHKLVIQILLSIVWHMIWHTWVIYDNNSCEDQPLTYAHD